MQNNNSNETQDIMHSLEGKRLRKIFRNADVIGKLHITLTSQRGNYFRKKLLNQLGDEDGADALEKLRQESGVKEYERHIQKLLQFHLIALEHEGDEKTYVRTELGEAAINAMRELERDVGREVALKIYDASLGAHSVQLFLVVYSDKREPDFETRKLKYTPQEAGQLAYFLHRSVEAMAAVDKLNDAGILAYEDDGHVYASSKILRGLYKYFLSLLDIAVKQHLIDGG